eukprot:TRINITY_DN443_c1_g6_i1.p1 TRINITY_DN443_c1_g6~~TRINITY_DN443_c1_g6_i1.p1  ORF type:complete len:745 (-),score=248.62 TRINITY_DN443_c1_g6_i1:42-2216(-)
MSTKSLSEYLTDDETVSIYHDDDTDDEDMFMSHNNYQKHNSIQAYQPQKVLCWKNAPQWAYLISQQITGERVKIGILLVVMLIAIGFFSFEPEEHDMYHLSATTSDDPKYIHVGTNKDAVLEVVVSVQENQFEDSGVEYFLNITLMGNDTAQGQVPLSNYGIEIIEIEQEELVHDFKLDKYDSYKDYGFLLQTNYPEPLGITFHYRHISNIVSYEVAIAAVTLVGVYILIVFELLHRTIAALLGSFVCLAVYSFIHARPSFETVIFWIDFETVGLLFGMMIMVGIFSGTGFFEYSAIKAYKWSRSNLWYLTVILCIFTAVVSAFLDNVTTILLLTPVTVRLCKVLDVKPEPILIAEVMFSNIGGTATAIGDPPNIIIVNDPRIKSTGEITFGNFTLHIGPGVVITTFITFFLVYFLFKRALRREPHQGKKKEIEIWKKTATRINKDTTEEEKHVYEQLMEYIHTLEEDMKRAPDDMTVKDVDIGEMEKKYRIHDMPLFISSCCVLGVVILFFFLHSWIEDEVELTLAWIAIMGAMVHLLVSGIHDVEEVLEKVELGTLLFFAALFVLMRGLEELGLVAFIGDTVSDLIEQVPEGSGRLAVAIILIIWVSAIVSAFIDNIPYTTTMVPVVYQLGTGNLKLPLAPLVWALSYGTCFGGNGTLIGASANVVAVGLAEQDGYHISFNTFFKTGFPVMLLSVFVATVYLLITHVAIHWGYSPDDLGWND